VRAFFATLLALSLLGSLMLASTASAATLSEKVAVKQATRLMNKQLNDRSRRLVEARISVGERRGKSRWLFLYDDLNRQGVVCNAVIEVRLSSKALTARFLPNSKCNTISDEVLSYRAAARFAGTAFAKKRRSVLRSVTRYTDSAQACETLDIPNDRQDEALLLLSTGLTQATIRPELSVLDNYATALQSLGATDPTLAAGAAAWRDYVDTVRALPKLAPSYCDALGKWAKNGFTDETAPVDFAALASIAQRIQEDGAAVRRAGRFLRARGIDPLTSVEFTLDDIIRESAPSTGRVAKQARAVERSLR
jgi:hypothetical protein